MTDVASEINGKITANRPGLGFERLRLAEHLTSLFDDILAFPTHAHDRSGTEELHQSGKERLGGQIGVMRGRHVFGRPDHFETHEFVAAFFESGDNVSDQSALDAIGFDGQKGAFPVGTRFTVDGEGLAGGRAMNGRRRPRQGRGPHGSGHDDTGIRRRRRGGRTSGDLLLVDTKNRAISRERIIQNSCSPVITGHCGGRSSCVCV